MVVFVFLICIVLPFYLMLWISANTVSIEPEEPAFDKGISLIIPFRNEDNNFTDLINCLENLHLNAQDEVILVDDQSDSSCADKFQNLSSAFRLIEIDKDIVSSKKHALSVAIKQAQNDWILTTDADCVFSESWLNAKRKGIQKQNCDMIISPVSAIALESGFFSIVSHIELVVLQTITRAAVKNECPFLANGANLMFKKSAWEKVGQYQSHEHLASGDDVLLLNSFKKAGLKILYHLDNDATVITKIRNNRVEWFNQRLRWASKTQHLNGWKEKLHAFFFILWMINFIPGLIAFGPMYALVLIPELLLLKFYSPIQISLNDALLWPIFRMIYPFLVFYMFILSFTTSNIYWKGRPIKQSS